MTRVFVSPVNHPEKYVAVEGCTVLWPPGAGKTLLATAIANECNANFKVSSFNISYVYESLLTVCRVLNSSRCSSVNQKQMSAKLSIKLVLQLLASCVLVHSMAPCTPWHDAFAIHTWMLAFAWWFYFASYFWPIGSEIRASLWTLEWRYFWPLLSYILRDNNLILYHYWRRFLHFLSSHKRWSLIYRSPD